MPDFFPPTSEWIRICPQGLLTMLAARNAHPEQHDRASIYIPRRHRLFVRRLAAEEGVPESMIYKRLIEQAMNEECEGK